MKHAILLTLLATQGVLAADTETFTPELSIMSLPAPSHAAHSEFSTRDLLRAKAYSDKLRAQRGVQPQVMAHTVELKWPVRNAISVPLDESVQYLSHHLDQDTGGGIQDWACGMRAYNGHNGTDIGIGPFAWWKMRRDEGIVIAAAKGTIVQKNDGNPEDSCTFDDKPANQVIVEHADGSWGIYAHMRTDSLTHKSLGDTVYEGEYLGVIGSAGVSTGPHLHLGVGFWETDGNTQTFVVQDPWDGPCDAIGGGQWWETQPAQFITYIMSAATHSAAPVTPACPQSETPNYSNSFNAGDPIVFSTTVHDWLNGQTVRFTVRRPNGTTPFAPVESTADQDRLRATFLSFSWTLPGNAPSGMWTLEVNLGTENLVHEFWVGGGPQPPPPIMAVNNQYNGLYYDPALSGEGYNFITAPNGTIIFFYGSDVDGNRIWLLSELITAQFQDNQDYEIIMYESTGGVWDKPIKSSRGLSIWGLLTLRFSTCNGGTAELEGVDGAKISNIIKLAGVPGTGCVAGERSDNHRSGLWYDPALTGEGFNVIVAPNGVVVFYYGFDKDGNRLWMHSNVIADILVQDVEVMGTMFRSGQGTFAVPVANALVNWGTITLKAISCSEIQITMETNEGQKVSATIRLAQVIGVNCS